MVSLATAHFFFILEYGYLDTGEHFSNRCYGFISIIFELRPKVKGRYTSKQEINAFVHHSQMDATMDLMKQMLMEMRQKDEEDRRECEQIREEERREQVQLRTE